MSTVDSEGSTSRASTTSHTSYRKKVLPRNKVHIYHSLREIHESSKLSQFHAVIKSLIEMLSRPVSVSCKLSRQVVAQYGEDYVYGADGYENSNAIDAAVSLSFEATRAAASNATGNFGWRLLLAKYFDVFNYSERYCQSTDEIWTYDPALTNFLPSRSGLRAPKPDYAYGLNFRVGSAIDLKIDLLPQVTMPGVSPVCSSSMIFPFLVLESKSNDGSIRTGENQLCNAMIKAHDILNSLCLQDKCFVFGFVQVECDLRYYLSFSTQVVDECSNQYADEVYLVKFHLSDLSTFRGSLEFLILLEFAGGYADEAFKPAVCNSVDSLIPQIPSSQSIYKTNKTDAKSGRGRRSDRHRSKS